MSIKSKLKKFSAFILKAGVFCVLLALSFPLFYFLVNQWDTFSSTQISLFIGLHIISSFLIGAFMYWQARDDEKKVWFWWGCGFSLFVPLVGGISSISSFLIAFHKQHHPEWEGFIDEDKIPLFQPKKKTDLSTEEVKNQIMLDRLDIEPISQIISGRDSNYKRGLIEKLSMRTDKEAVHYLKTLLAGDDYEIRLYASVALKNIEDELNRRILVAKEEVEADENSAEKHHVLAVQYYTLCNSDLLGWETFEYYLNLAIEQMDIAISIKPNQFFLYLDKGRYLVMLKRYKEAIETLKKAVELEPDNWQPYIWRAEAYYYLKDYNNVYEDAKSLSRLYPWYQKAMDVAQFWTGEIYE